MNEPQSTNSSITDLEDSVDLESVSSSGEYENENEQLKKQSTIAKKSSKRKKKGKQEDVLLEKAIKCLERTGPNEKVEQKMITAYLENTLPLSCVQFMM